MNLFWNAQYRDDDVTVTLDNNTGGLLESCLYESEKQRSQGRIY